MKALMHFGKGKKISVRLIVFIVAFSSLITLGISAIQLVLDYRQQRHDLSAILGQIAIYEPNISASVWSFDQRQIELALGALSRLPNVERASITTPAHDKNWSAGELLSRHVVTQTYPLTHSVADSEEVIGTLEIVASLDAIYQSVAAHAVTILLSNGLKTFLVALFMLFLFRRLVTTRLEALARTAATLVSLVLPAAACSEAAPKRLSDEGDEFDTVQRAFDDMGQKLKSAVGELRSNQQLLQSIIDNSTAVISVKDLAGCYLLINRRFEELFHVGREAIIGRSAYDLFAEEHARALQASDQAVIDADRVLEKEEVVPQDDGLHTYISIKAPLHDEQGQPYAICTIATDISARKRAEEELKFHRDNLEELVASRTLALEGENTERRLAEQKLRKSQDFLNNIINAASDPVFVKDRQHRWIILNDAVCEMIGHTREELLGKSDFEYFPRHEADIFWEKDEVVFQSQQENTNEETLTSATGKVVTIMTKKTTFFDVDGNQFLVGIIRDITQRKQAEELLKDRSIELLAAKVKADVANQAKSAFLASMSHELRTPLNAILGYAQILKRDKSLSERQAVGLNTILQSGEHLLTLINDVLDLSKIEADKLGIYPNVFNLRASLRVIGDIVRVKAEKKSLIFSLDIDESLPVAVRADEKRLRQVLLNLLSNAIKFTDRGAVIFRVRELSCSDSDRDNDIRLRFEVQDSGIGIEADLLEVIFEPFEQVGAVQQRYGGTGLGLAISRKLVRLMGSDIQVESQPGKGSCFWFDIAVAPAADVAAIPAARAITGYQGSCKKVLIVDDAVANRAMLVDLLGSLGFDTAEASNGQEALEQAQGEMKTAPDLIIMDMVMPVMDGPQAMRRMRLIPALQAVPIIAVSASATEEDQTHSLAAGANVFLSKPIESASLLQQIGERLNLTWKYEESDEENNDKEREAGEKPLVVPEHAELVALRALAQTGNMRDILHWAEHLVSLGEQYRPFADKLRRLADGYQSKAIMALVEQQLAASRTP